MDLFDAIETRRSVREFLDEPVDRTVLEQVALAGIEAPSGCNLQCRQYILVDDPKLMAQMRPMSPAMTGAPAAIVLVMDPQDTPYGSYWVQDASAAMQNMLLAATALGYATCWVEGQVRHGWEEKLREMLGVPENLRVWSVTPVGKPAGEARRPRKSAPADVIHINGFGGKA